MKKIVVALSIIALISANAVIAAPKSPKAPAAPLVETESTISLIKGCVMSNDNELLAGALVVVNGKKVYTDFDGRFTIEAPAGSKAEVSMISYLKSQITLSTSTTGEVNIILQQQ